MKMFSDISTLINILNPKQRDRFKNLLEEFKKEGINENIRGVDFTISDIIEGVEATIDYETHLEKVREAVSKGKTTIPKKDWGVHETHCCLAHGCKYGREDCPVVMEFIKQKYPCEECHYDINGKYEEDTDH